MTITKDQVNILTQIYQNLLLIPTKGEDTFRMAECLQAFGQIMNQIQSTDQQNTGNTEE